MSNAVFAQEGESPISYKSLATQMSTLTSNGDASSAAATSVSSFNGFGSYMDNPASMALSKGSFYSIGWINQSNVQSNGYLGNTNTSNFSNTAFGNFGVVYKVPTERGSFVLGGGYSLISKDNNESFLSGFNGNNSITDVFKQPSSDFNNIALDAYAIDFRNETSDEIESIFRVDTDDPQPRFAGINQFANISNRKTIGDISIFASTEIQKNLFIGVSLGVLSGSIKYDRNFEEVDEDNLYADGAIPEDGSNPATDIYSITLTDNLVTDFYAFTARGGIIYKALPFLNLGASIVLPSKMIVTESYFANIDTELDDFTAFLDNNFSSEFDYSVTRPAEFKVGATLKDIGNLSLSASAEYITYSSAKVDLTINRTLNELSPSEVAFLSDDEQATNEAIRRDYAAVINFRSNAAYSLENGVKLIAGYSYYPGKNKVNQFDKSVYSVGLSFPLTNSISADISGQYFSRNDRYLVYEFENDANEVFSNSISQTVDRLNILAGIKFKF
tara:strand:- start:2009 stop:3514 length:1506 start_codon:yes stop_codon:yes gene_type:complete